MKRYSSYRDSGVEWIGEIPRHWRKTKLKFISVIITGTTPSKNDDENYIDGEYLWVKPNDLKGIVPVYDTKEKLSLQGKQLTRSVPPYSVLINGIGNIGEYGYSKMEVSTNQQINSIVFNKIIANPTYGIYLISSMKNEFVRNSEKVVVPILNKTKNENIETPLPPLPEQQQIVQFLDTKTVLIDTLIEKTQRKIELLKEKRTSLINHTVTKGLNPYVEMKDSGVEWIGEIPRHWRFIPTKYFTVDKNGVQTGPFGTQLNTKDYVASGVKVMNQKTLINEDYDIGDEYISHEKYEELKGMDVIGGDIIMGTRGSFGSGKRTTFGKVSIVPDGLGDCVLHPCLIRIRLREDIILKSYYYFYINDSTFFLDDIRNTSNSTTIEVIYGVTLKDIQIPIPPVSEQLQIVEFLDEQTSIIDTTISKEERRIELLKEYRQSLISEVVTGKIKVTNDE